MQRTAAVNVLATQFCFYSLSLFAICSLHLSLSALLVLCDIQHTNPCSDTRAGCGPALPLGKRLNIREGHKEAGLERSKNQISDDKERGEAAHAQPSLLPDEKHCHACVMLCVLTYLAG